MSSFNNRQLLSLATGLLASTVMSTIQNQANERKRSESRQINDLQRRKVSLTNKIINAIEITKSQSMEALLAQVLNCNLSDIPEYEKCFGELCPSRPRPMQTMQTIQTSRSVRPMPFVFQPVQMEDIFSVLLSLENKTESVEVTPTIKEDEKKVCITFKDFQREAANSTCAICLEKYIGEDEVEIRHCSHSFHKKCLIPWENSNRTNGKVCPCCRR